MTDHTDETSKHGGQETDVEQKPTSSMRRVLARRDFRLLAAGTGTSLLGDQFSMIAMPWLVLQLTHDPMLLGATLALEGVPRAVLMLFGGAVSDKFSPRRVLQVTSAVRAVLTALLAVMVVSGTVQPWMVLVASGLFGAVAGFSVPAENSMVPHLLDTDDLQAGNSVIMGLGQLAGFVGPTIAGIIIGAYAQGLTGVAVALGIDALSFVVCYAAFTIMRPQGRSDSRPPVEGSIIASTLIGLRYLWADATLRTVFAVLVIVNFLIMGPLLVGIPLLADQRLPEGSAAFGLLMSAFAVGNLIGYIGAGALPRPAAAALRWIVILLVAAFGVIVAGLGVVSNTWLDFALLAVLGVGNGFVSVLIISWMQARVPEEMTGRMMGVLTLASSGLVPASAALAGVLSSASLTLLFVGPGMLVVLVAFGLYWLDELHRLGAELTKL